MKKLTTFLMIITIILVFGLVGCSGGVNNTDSSSSHSQDSSSEEKQIINEIELPIVELP